MPKALEILVEANKISRKFLPKNMSKILPFKHSGSQRTLFSSMVYISCIIKSGDLLLVS